MGALIGGELIKALSTRSVVGYASSSPATPAETDRPSGRQPRPLNRFNDYYDVVEGQRLEDILEKRVSVDPAAVRTFVEARAARPSARVSG